MRPVKRNARRHCRLGRVAISAAVLLLIAASSAAAASASAGGRPAPAGQFDFASLKQRQTLIRNTVADIAKKMEAEDAMEKRIRAALYVISSDHLVGAIEMLEKLSRTRSPAEVKQMADQVLAAQDYTIKVIQRILGIIDSLENKAKTEHDPGQGEDLPDDLNDKMDKLNEKLKEFIEEQKKVIEGSKDLAKMPVDDFSPEDEQKLKQLEATEEKWSKFLKEAHTDLSKVPEQDFSNPAMLKELIEIYSEVKMAKDALSKKAVEIAVPAEEAGAELAKSLQTNIEKWLPDTPDRQKWQMEEPLQDFQVPMAELPKELEDLVGDLMEEEEDLMNDIEDASSAWADSLDKGAGWDAMDGPISNMSAKGVTGNRLPNKSEIGGRSGEGRTGKSSGEFVEQVATGKGGRRTPTRLTPDPFEKGVVDDRSKDPPGGATGGGKISGGGAEGLEGPVPPETEQQMKALAGRQAELRQQAEKIQLGLKVMNYPTEELSKTIRLMKSMERGLQSGRYRNVLRRKGVMLRNLKDTQMFLKGETRVHRDRSLGLPTRIQDQIVDAMGDVTPKGFEDLLKGYYQALSKTEGR